MPAQESRPRRRVVVEPDPASVPPVLAQYASAPTIAALARAYPALPRSERKVADFILGHAQEVPHLTSTELGARVGVSQSIVSRLCQRVYDGGYGQLRLGLAQELAVAGTDGDREVGEAQRQHGNDDEILRRTFEDLAIAERAIALLDRERLRAAARMLVEANGIVTCGMSLSGAMGQRLAQLLYMEGLTARYEPEPFHPPHWSVGLQAGGVLTAISYRGNAPELNNLVQHAKDSGASVLLITNEARCAQARTADLVLATHAPSAPTEQEYAGGPGLYVQLATIRALWLAVRAELATRGGRS